MVLDATNFASSYVENLGNGNFKIAALPIQAQFSSINDIIINDFDNDGHLDVVVGGNLYASEVETTRNDAGVGLVLKGDGIGGFESIPYSKTGLLLRNDVKKMKTLQTKNGTILLVANNNDRLESFKIN